MKVETTKIINSTSSDYEYEPVEAKCYPTNSYFFISGDANNSFPKHRVHIYHYLNDDKSIAPAFAFANDELCLFCHNDEEIVEELDGIMKNFVDGDIDADPIHSLLWYQISDTLKTLNGEAYNSLPNYAVERNEYMLETDNPYNAFESTLKLYEDDELCEYKINWKMSNKFSYEKPNDIDPDDLNEITINLPPNMLKSEAIYEVLKQEMFPKVSEEIEDCINELGLSGTISNFYIGDPTASGWYEIKPNYEKVISPATSGCCYITKQTKVGQETNYFLNANKCILTFSPIIYYCNSEKRKRLIQHELVHAIVGVDHCHDDYFWDTYEKITGYSRTYDFLYYDKQQSDRDTDNWNWNHSKSESTEACKKALSQHYKQLKRYGIKQI